VQDARRGAFDGAELRELIENHATVITRALGLSADVKVDTAVLPRDAIQEAFLCSDGLWRPFDPNLNGAAPPNLTGQALLDWAFEAYERHGEHDNATGLVVKL
jgi:serine/threonine protein phosphatase PrpC